MINSEGEIHFCVCPSESLLSSWTSDTAKVKPIAVATLLYDDTSAIVTKASSGITTLQDLKGKRYASYEGRFEMAIVNSMVQDSVIEVKPPKLECFEAVLNGDADATWIFLGWEGITAKRRGIDLNTFPVSGTVPYGYSPLLLAHPKLLETNPELVKTFLDVTARGYAHAAANPDDAAKYLMDVSKHPSLDALGGLDFVTEATTFLANGGHYINPAVGKWGVMNEERWTAYVDWLTSAKLLTYRDGSLVQRGNINMKEIFTNEFIA